MSNNVGFYFKSIRLFKGITIKEVCEKTKISREYLKKIENETRFISINKTMSIKMQQALGVQLQHDYNLVKSFNLLSEKFIHSCLFNRHKSALSYYVEIQKKEREIGNSILFPYFILIRYIHLVLYEKDELELEWLEGILAKICNHFDAYKTQLYQLFLAVHTMDLNHEKKALDLFEECLGLSNDPLVHSQIYLYMGQIQLSQGNDLEAFLMTSKAKELFDANCNYYCSVISLVQLSQIWIYLNGIKRADSLCNTAILAAKIVADSAVLYESYVNLARMKLYHCQYNQVSDILNTAMEIYTPGFEIYFYNAYAFYKLEDHIQAMAWIEKGLQKFNDSKSYQYRLLLLMKELKQRPKRKIRFLQAMIPVVQTMRKKDRITLHILYEELIGVFKQIEDYEKAFLTYEEYYKKEYK